ncbi:hypothetical protein [Streptomyces sp. NPDC002599]|uniref:hypothetical protein n=1 Tax=Streptomyces sp. NPDC002599 TaxID=3154421 RepID=UPI00332ADEA5
MTAQPPDDKTTAAAPIAGARVCVIGRRSRREERERRMNVTVPEHPLHPFLPEDGDAR